MWLSMVTILGICALQLTHPHTAVNTHTWSTIYAAAPGEQLGIRFLAQGHHGRGIEGGESTVHSPVAVCFGSLSCWNTHPRPIFNALAPTVHGSVHRPFNAVQLSCPLSRKQPQSIMFPLPCLMVEMVFLRS